MEIYLKKNKDKVCEKMQPVFSAEEYVKYKDTQVKILSDIEIEKYMSERNKAVLNINKTILKVTEM